MQKYLRQIAPHSIVFILFCVAALLYFNPVLSGKEIIQSDIVQYRGMAKQQNDFRAKTGEETYWTQSAFGGMPTYQLGAKYPHNYIKNLDLALRFLPRPADYLLLYFIGMYILLLVFKIDYKLAFLGALAFGFSTYLIIILGVGHNAKAHAIAYMPLVIAGIVLTFQQKYFKGFVLTSLALALELVANHFQMTYYLLLLVLCIGIAYLVDAYGKKMLPHFFKSVAVLFGALIIALGLNATNILATQEYASQSTRGASAISITPEGTLKEKKQGLDYDYITEYSYGKLETFNLLIPRFMGGGNSESVPKNSKTVALLREMGANPADINQILYQIPMYWGAQPIVAAPAYVGAIIIFLAIMGLFLIKGRLKWWSLAGVLLSLLLSWGDNFKWLTQFFIDYIPLYNKFRAVSSIQVILELVMPIIAVVGLHQFFNNFYNKEEKKKALLYAFAIVGGITLVFLTLSGIILSFSSPYDTFLIDELGMQFIDAVRADRKALLTADALRSFILIILTAGSLWLLLHQKLKATAVIVILTGLIVFDLVGVNLRYVNQENFVESRIVKNPFTPNNADVEILKDEGYFRVFDATTNAFSSGRASFFHQALGGYHAAKLGRVQDIYDFYIEKGNTEIFNMLNVKYFILSTETGEAVAQENPLNNGPVWWVEEVLPANSVNEEIVLLDTINTKTTAVIHREFLDKIPSKDMARDTTATIDLVEALPNKLVYETASKTPQLAVFSEIFYPHGWQAYINDQPVTHFRANYLLRALPVPEGMHTVTFKFEPQVVSTGSTISLISSILLIFIIISFIFYYYKKKKLNNSIA